MKRPARLAATAAATLLALIAATGCDRVLNGPKAEAYQRPDKVHDFAELYGQNCAGCHGNNGLNGPAIPLGNSIYLALASEQSMIDITSNGETGTQMPAFATKAGGLLTDDQIKIIVDGIRAWEKPATVPANLPPYTSTLTANATHGSELYAQSCARCHGDATPGATPGKAGSVTDPNFLALINDQSLRTIIIAGRPDLGHPDFANVLPGHPLTDQDVTDVVAFVASHRQATPAADSTPADLAPAGGAMMMMSPKPKAAANSRRSE